MKKAISFWLLMASVARAQDDWLPIDARSKGTGNAGVAFAEGSSAPYWNPSKLALGAEEFDFFGDGFSFQGNVYFDTAIDGEILAKVDTLTDLYTGLDFAGIQSRFNAGTSTNQDLQDAMRIIDAILAFGEDDQGVVGAVGGGGELRVGMFGVFARYMGQAGIDPFFDFTLPAASSFTSASLATFFGDFTVTGPLTPAAASLSLQLQSAGLAGDADLDGVLDADELAFHAQQSLGDAAISDPTFVSALTSIAQVTNAIAGSGSTTSTLFFNGSGVEIRGVTIKEFGVSAGFPILPTLAVGITLREVIAETFRVRILLRDLEDGSAVLEELLDNFDKNTARTQQFTADFGISFQPFPFLTLGLTAKNLIPMSFDFKGTSEDFEIGPQLRFGVMVAPFGILKIGVDVDVLENNLDSLVDGLRSRVLGGGAELDLSLGDAVALKIRGGLFDNVASTSSGPTWTAGLGFKLFGFFLDANAQIAFSEVKIEEASGLNGTGVDRVPERISGSFTLGYELKF